MAGRQQVGTRLVNLNPLHPSRLEHHFRPAAVLHQPPFVIQSVLQPLNIFKHVKIGAGHRYGISLPVIFEIKYRVQEITLGLSQGFADHLPSRTTQKRQAHRQITSHPCRSPIVTQQADDIESQSTCHLQSALHLSLKPGRSLPRRFLDGRIS